MVDVRSTLGILVSGRIALLANGVQRPYTEVWPQISQRGSEDCNPRQSFHGLQIPKPVSPNFDSMCWSHISVPSAHRSDVGR